MFIAEGKEDSFSGVKSIPHINKNLDIKNSRNVSIRLNSKNSFGSRDNSATEVVKKASEYLNSNQISSFKKSIPSVSSSLQQLVRVESAKSDIKIDLESMKHFSSDNFYSSISKLNDSKSINSLSRLKISKSTQRSK